MSKYLSSLFGLILSITFFVFGESIIVFVTLKLGFIRAFILFVPIFFIVEYLIYSIYVKRLSYVSFFKKLQDKLVRVENRIPKRWQVLARTSKTSAVLVCSILSGIIVTPVFIGLLGYKNNEAIIELFVSAAIFALFWTFFYSGAILGYINIFHG